MEMRASAAVMPGLQFVFRYRGSCPIIASPYRSLYSLVHIPLLPSRYRYPPLQRINRRLYSLARWEGGKPGAYLLVITASALYPTFPPPSSLTDTDQSTASHRACIADVDSYSFELFPGHSPVILSLYSTRCSPHPRLSPFTNSTLQAEIDVACQSSRLMARPSRPTRAYPRLSISRRSRATHPPRRPLAARRKGARRAPCLSRGARVRWDSTVPSGKDRMGAS